MTAFEPFATAEVTCEYQPQRGLSVAYFEWPDTKITDTYTIDGTPSLSIRLDSHFPVRLSSVSLYDEPTESAEASARVLADYVGRPLTETLTQIRHIGWASLHVVLDSDHRHAIAQLQATSPSTPPPLRRLCEVMVDEYQAHKRQTNPNHAA